MYFHLKVKEQSDVTICHQIHGKRSLSVYNKNIGKNITKIYIHLTTIFSERKKSDAKMFFHILPSQT